MIGVLHLSFAVTLPCLMSWLIVGGFYLLIDLDILKTDPNPFKESILNEYPYRFAYLYG